MKKSILTTAIILGIAITAHPQKITDKKIETVGKKTEMKLSFAENIKIEAWNNNYIGFYASANIDENRYNDFYEVEISEKPDKVEIVEKVDFEGIKKKKGEENLCNFNTEINYTIKVPKNLSFSINTISGEMAINSVSGFIDYSVSEKHKAKIDLSTVTGDVYSNVKFDDAALSKISWVGTKRKLTLNGGNTDVKLKTVSGDIFLRKY